MARLSTSTGLYEQTQADSLHPIILVSMEISSTTIFMHTGIGDLSYGGNTYSGTGDFLAFSNVEESLNLSANAVQLSLSGVPSTMLNVALDEIRWGKSVKIYFGAISSTGLIGPDLIFEGITDEAGLDEGPENSVITVTAENRLIDLERPRTRRYTTEDQQIRAAGDQGFEYVPLVKNMEIKFGVR